MVQFALRTLLVDLTRDVVGIDIEDVRISSLFRKQDVVSEVVFGDQLRDFAIWIM